MANKNRWSFAWFATPKVPSPGKDKAALIKGAKSQKMTSLGIGGPGVHVHQSGCADVRVPDDDTLIAFLRAGALECKVMGEALGPRCVLLGASLISWPKSAKEGEAKSKRNAAR